MFSEWIQEVNAGLGGDHRDPSDRVHRDTCRTGRSGSNGDNKGDDRKDQEEGREKG